MKIPSRFKSILESNQRMNGLVLYTISQYEEILLENKLYFFEEYTDHGIKHIESVLESSDKLISDSTFEEILRFSSDSIGIYVLSVILHDIGMHITPEGFNLLILGKNDNIRISELDHKTWSELWNDFLDDARRYGDREKINLFGNLNWKFKLPNIGNKDKLDGEDKKLIGEFIRIYHTRLAHEIAINGFPTINNNIPFVSELNLDLRNICGLLARSHGVDVRNLFEYLKLKFQETWAKPYNLELIYLMIILRIADYFQVDSSRTPEVVVKIKTFKSPISQIEHFKHLDVKYVQPFIKDPETIIFQCEPRNSVIFVKLKDLFEDIQQELDKSWAILGEVYGKEGKEKQPTIRFRRVKSNIDNIQEYSKKINYIPEKISFSVSSELPKLLVGPLYGEDPTYGIRELMQNAVDSCREREFMELGSYKGEIKISFFEKGSLYYFRIEDNGMGMSLNVVKNYFLEVGTSLRKSSYWKKLFSDKDGKSMVQRSGKFGIGVLAAFLIGEKIFIETRDSNSVTGLSLTTNLNTEQIEVIKIEKENVGTRITIEIQMDTLKKLQRSTNKFDQWYNHATPSVVFIDKIRFFGSLGHKNLAPGFKDALSNEWHEIQSDSFEKVIWTYNKHFFDNKFSKLTCNGIFIPQGYYSMERYNFDLPKLPFVSIFDFNGTLPLSLSRSHIEGQLDFMLDLVKEIYKDVVAKLLSEVVAYPFDEKGNLQLKNVKRFYHPAISSLGIIYSKEGFILKNHFFIKKYAESTILNLSPRSEVKIVPFFDLKNAFTYIVEKEDVAMSDFQFSANLAHYQHGGKLFLSSKMYARLFDNAFNRYPVKIRKLHSVLHSNTESSVIEYKFGHGAFSLNEISNVITQCNFVIESKLGGIPLNYGVFISDLLDAQLEVFLGDNSIIPYDFKMRKEKFKNTFIELEKYFLKYLTPTTET